jgi:sodium-dependent dicarboxylate transporter 2/3/5
VAVLAGPVLALFLLLFFDLSPGRPEVTRTAAVAVLMAVWWITEAIPLAATSLLPVVLFPAFGVMSGKTVAGLYFNHIIFLFIGGFMVALAMERWKLHRRIALRILLWVGVRPSRMLLGFMLATAFLSMWISNTATTMMMVPIAMATTVKLEERFGEDRVRRYATGLFLGIAYAASIGGIATLVGTPPNLSFARIIGICFPAAPDVSFASWLVFALPVSVVLLASAWVVLSLLFCRGADVCRVELDPFTAEYQRLGPMTYEEKVVLADFALLALLWVFRADIQVGDFTLPGWSRLFPNADFLNDGTVSVGMALLLFLLPAGRGRGERIMDWETAGRLPWNIVLLFGGGFALASGFKESGLSLWIGSQLEGVSFLPPLLIVGAVCLLVTFLTELTSNTATAEMLLPVLAALGVAVKLNPLLLMIPGTLSCSCAFMLPVATPPNAIVFGTQRLRIADMARVGIILNLLGVACITAAAFLLLGPSFGVDTTGLPTWATTP